MTGVVSHRRSSLGSGLLKVAICLLFTGCGGSSEGTAERAGAERHSWEATLALLEEEAARGAVPAEFAQQVRQAAEEEHRKAEAQRERGSSR
jgi:hypothetical protein